MGSCIQRLKLWFKMGNFYRINGKSLHQIGPIAEGGFGYVLLVQDTDNNKKYALKKMNCQTKQHKQNYKKQVQIMKKLTGCKHVIGFHGNHEIQRGDILQAYILMELAQKSLFDLIMQNQKTGKTLTQQQIIVYIRQVVLGLKEMHDAGVMHHDLKVQNILITHEKKIKLCDLGSCSTQKIVLQNATKAQLYKYQQRFQKFTTLMYRPPQMIDLYLKYPVDDRVDIWMLGCVLFSINFKYHPFQNQGKLSIVNASINYPKRKVSEKMEDLMRHLLTPNPSFRPNINQILNILDNWNDTQKIKLNKVAASIKQDEIYIEKGEYDKVSKGQWRNFK